MENVNSNGVSSEQPAPAEGAKAAADVLEVLDIVEELPDGLQEETEEAEEPTQVLDSFDVVEEGKQSETTADPVAIVDVLEELSEDADTSGEAVEPTEVLDDSTETAEPGPKQVNGSAESIDIIIDPDDCPADAPAEPMEVEVLEEPADETDSGEKPAEEENVEVLEEPAEDPPEGDAADAAGKHCCTQYCYANIRINSVLLGLTMPRLLTW